MGRRMNQARPAHPNPERTGGYNVATEGGGVKDPVKGRLVTACLRGGVWTRLSAASVHPPSASTSTSSVPDVHQLYTILRNGKG